MLAQQSINHFARVLVTGANGFVGKPLCDALIRQNYLVKAAARNPINGFANCDFIKVTNISADTDWASALCGVDVVIHVAARVHVMNDNAADPLTEFRKVNVDGH